MCGRPRSLTQVMVLTSDFIYVFPQTVQKISRLVVIHLQTKFFFTERKRPLTGNPCQKNSVCGRPRTFFYQL